MIATLKTGNLSKKGAMIQISASLSIIMFFSACTQNPVMPVTQRIDQLLSTPQLKPIAPRQDLNNNCSNLDLEHFNFSGSSMLNLVSCFNKNKELQGLEDLFLKLQNSQKLEVLGQSLQTVGRADKKVLDSLEQIQTNFDLADAQIIVKALSDSQMSKIIIPLAEKVFTDGNQKIENTDLTRLDFFFTRLLAFIFDYRAPVDGTSRLKSTVSSRNILALKNLVSSKAFSSLYEQKAANFINEAAHDSEKANKLREMLKELSVVARISGSKKPDLYRVDISNYLYSASKTGYLKDLAFFVLGKINEKNEGSPDLLAILGRSFQDLKSKELIGCNPQEQWQFKEGETAAGPVAGFICNPPRKAGDSLLKTDQEWKLLYQNQKVSRGNVNSSIPQLGKANELQAVLRLMQEIDYDSKNDFTLTHMLEDLLATHRAGKFDDKTLKSEFRKEIFNAILGYFSGRYYEELVKFYVAEVIYPTFLSAQAKNMRLDDAMNTRLLESRKDIANKLDTETFDIIGQRVLGPVFNFLDFQIDRLIQDSNHKDAAIDSEKLKDLKTLISGIADDTGVRGIRSPLLYCAASSFGLLQGKTKFAEDKQLYQRIYVAKALPMLKWLDKNSEAAKNFFNTYSADLQKGRAQDSSVWQDPFYKDLVKKISDMPIPSQQDDQKLPDGLNAACGANTANNFMSLNEQVFQQLIKRVTEATSKSDTEKYDGLGSPQSDNTASLFDLIFDKIWEFSKKIEIPKAKDGSDLDTLALLTQGMSNFEPATIKRLLDFAFNDLKLNKQIIGDVQKPGILYKLVGKFPELLLSARKHLYSEIEKVTPNITLAKNVLCDLNQADFKTCNAKEPCETLAANKDSLLCKELCGYLNSEKQYCSSTYKKVCVLKLGYENNCVSEPIFEESTCEMLKQRAGRNLCTVYYQTQCTKNNAAKYPFDFEACGLLEPLEEMTCDAFISQFSPFVMKLPDQCRTIDENTAEEVTQTAKVCPDVAPALVAEHEKLFKSCNRFLDANFCNFAMAGAIYPADLNNGAVLCKEKNQSEIIPSEAMNQTSNFQSSLSFVKSKYNNFKKSFRLIQKSFAEVLADVENAGKPQLTAESPAVLAVNARFAAYYAKISFFLENIEVLHSLVNGSASDSKNLAGAANAGDAGMLEFLIPLWKATFKNDALNADTLRLLTRDIPESAPKVYNVIIDQNLLAKGLGLLGAFSTDETDMLTGNSMLNDLLTGLKHLTFPLGYDNKSTPKVFPISVFNSLIVDVDQEIDTQRLTLPYPGQEKIRLLDLSTHAIIALGQLPAHGIDQALLTRLLDAIVKTDTGLKLMEDLLNNAESRAKTISGIHSGVELLVAMAKTGKLNAAADNLIALDQKGNLRQIAELLLSFKDPENKYKQVKTFVLNLVTSGQLRNLLIMLKPLTIDMEDYYSSKEIDVRF